jgi:hydroxymethylglutaryl-CoA lyase
LPRLVGHDVPSQVLKAGARERRHPLPHSFDAIRARAAVR